MLLTRKINLRYFFIYLGVTVFSVLFTIIYYMNSYGMTDNHLTYLFVPPLITALIFLLFFIFKTPYPFRKKCQDSRQYESFHSSIL